MKYHFELPGVDLRKAFALKWLGKIHAEEGSADIQFGKEDCEIAEVVAQKTDGWSFAFLKEL